MKQRHLCKPTLGLRYPLVLLRQPGFRFAPHEVLYPHIAVRYPIPSFELEEIEWGH
ncbi:MAG: hypothetical protein ACP5HM_09240 [Anaerolineae bacterium]